MNKKGTLVAVRPENIIEARFSLTAKQNDILDIIFTQLEDDDNNNYSIDISRYKKLYNTDTSNIYRDMEKAVQGFEGKGLTLTKAASRGKVYFAWFSKIDYKPNEGKIDVRMDSELKQLFLEVKKKVYYHIKYTLNFSGIYSKRLYYYLKSFEDTGWRIDNIDALREKLQCPVSYKKYGLFRTNVIDSAKEEINGSSDIQFEVEEIKEKRKVVALRFIIKPNKQCGEMAIDINNDEKCGDTEVLLVQEIFNEKLNEKISLNSAREILDSAKLHNVFKDPIKLIVEVAEYSKTQKITKGIVGWFKATVKVYERPIRMPMNDNFNNFEQRDYDYDVLEKKLLGWDNLSELSEEIVE